MALGHCRHRIHSLGWSIVMFFLIYWACIDEPWVSLVTHVQSAIKNRSNLLKNVSFTQAGLHIWAATATTSINNEYTSSHSRWAEQQLQALAPRSPGSSSLRSHQPGSARGRSTTPENSETSPGERRNPCLPVLLTDGWLQDMVSDTRKLLPSACNTPSSEEPATSDHKHQGEACGELVG